MATVKEIPPRKKEPSLKKVAAYCRVSTKTQEQLGSLVTQENYYEDKIKENSDWQFAGIYSDVGIGTTIKDRKRLNALISACRRGRIDMILIKSASRFAHNTVDALKIIRMLRRWKVDIYFEADDIHTVNENSEFILTLICTQIQDESESKSADIKWGIRKSFSNPDSKYYQRKCYGYKHDKDGRLIIDETEANVVRMIFRMANEGGKFITNCTNITRTRDPITQGKSNMEQGDLKKNTT